MNLCCVPYESECIGFPATGQLWLSPISKANMEVIHYQDY